MKIVFFTDFCICNLVLLIVNDRPTLIIFVESSVVFLNTLVIIGFIFGNLFRQIYFIKVDKPSILRSKWTRNRPSKEGSNGSIQQRHSVQFIAQNIREKELVVRACASENNVRSINHSNGNIPMIASAENVISTIDESENQLNESDFMDVPCI